MGSRQPDIELTQKWGLHITKRLKIQVPEDELSHLL